MSEAHLPKPDRIAFLMFWSWQIFSNCTTLQLVQVVASNALQNNQWASGHLKNAFSKSLSQARASKAPTEIRFFFNWRTYLTFFNSLIILLNNLMRNVPIPSIWHVCPSPNDAKRPSSFSKLANHSRLGQMIGSTRIQYSLRFLWTTNNRSNREKTLKIQNQYHYPSVRSLPLMVVPSPFWALNNQSFNVAESILVLS